MTSEPGKGSLFSFTLPIFSLANLIRPILAEQKEPGNSIALFAAQIEPRDGSPDAKDHPTAMIYDLSGAGPSA